MISYNMTMDRKTMEKAFRALDSKIASPLTLLIGGGAAMLLAYDVPLTTHDVDGLPIDSAMSAAELDRLIKEVATDLGISGQWYNDYFNTFTYALPTDFRERLTTVFKGKKLIVKALGKEDLLIMKCMAGREKDIGHARALIRRGADWRMVEKHLEALSEKGLSQADDAILFLEDLTLELDDV